MKLADKVELWKDRFHGRRDVFGRIYTKIVMGEKKPKKSVSPVYIDKYRDKKAREGVDFKAPEELYVPLKDEHIEAHIQGRMEIMIYLPRVDGTTSFFAIDFDFQHGFNEVLAVSDALDFHGITHGIARSTTKGHHIYVFFDAPIEAYYITNYVRAIYTDLGYMEKIRNGEIVGHTDKGKPVPWTNPELFPKVISISGPTNTGNGIKPALYGKAVENDQCCFVDRKNQPIGGSGKSVEQWNHLASIPKIKPEAFKKKIEELGINVEEDMRLSEKRGAVKQVDRKRLLPYQKPEDGDFMLVINGCPAFRRLWEGPVKDMPHDARVAMLSMALKCKNGLEIIREKFGDSPITNQQIQYAMETSQQPWCCKTMQDYDICLKGKDPVKSTGNTQDKYGNIITDHCFEKSPPREIINGKLKINPHNLPEEQWPWPSPIRNRIPFQKKGVRGIKDEIDQLTKEDPKLDEKLEKLFRKIVSLKDAKTRGDVLDYLKDKKLVLVKTLKHYETVALQEKKEDQERRLDSQDGFRTSNDVRYAVVDGDGYAIVRMTNEGDDDYLTISNFEIEFELDRTNHPIIGSSERWFEGRIRCEGKSYPFKITAEDYSNSNKLGAAIFSAVGPQADFKGGNLEYIRAAAKLFGTEKLRVLNTYEDYGFDSKKHPRVYRSTTGNITENGFSYEDDDSNKVDLRDSQFAKHLGLKDLNKSDFMEVCHVLKHNILSMQESHLTITMIAHAMQAAIHNAYMPFNEAPILWMQGLTGVGKSELGGLAQSFHGDFPKPMSINTTARSIDQYAMIFKDALLVLDDFKKAHVPEKMIVPLIQKIYDRSERGRLSSNLKQSNTVNCRGLVMVTAEDPPTSEASVMARLIYIESSKKLSGSISEKENYREVIKVKDKLSGITARFIQYMLQTYPKPAEVHEKFYEVNSMIGNGVFSKQNAPRIINNLSANYLTWELFLDFLISEEAITKEEYSEMMIEHDKNIRNIRDEMLMRCNVEQASNVFLSVLREAVSSGEAIIEGMGVPNKMAKVVGYCPDLSTKVIYLYPGTSYRVVQKALRESDSYLSHSKESIGKQMLEDGIIVKRQKNSTMYQKTHKGSRSYVWAIDAEKAGMGVILEESQEQPKVVNDNILPLPVDDM